MFSLRPTKKSVGAHPSTKHIQRWVFGSAPDGDIAIQDVIHLTHLWEKRVVKNMDCHVWSWGRHLYKKTKTACLRDHVDFNSYVCIYISMFSKKNTLNSKPNRFFLAAIDCQDVPVPGSLWNSPPFLSGPKNSTANPKDPVALPRPKRARAVKGGIGSICAYRVDQLPLLPYNSKVGPLPVINGVITPISRVITPVTHL